MQDYVGKEMLLEETAKLMGKEKLCGIYSITNILDGKVYVGLSKDIYVRAASHVKSNTSVHLNNAIAKYGIENFVHKIEMLCEEECLGVNENTIFYKYKNAGTVMYNVAECGFGGNTLKYATDERKVEVVTKRKVTLQTRTIEEIAEANAKIKAGLASRTAEQIAEASAKISVSVKEYLASRTAEQIAEANAKIKAGLASRTAEQIAEANAKMSAGIKATWVAKYCNVVENTIKFCLQNKLFTFGKYKQYCTANNLELLVSPAYFGRIMKFGKYKEQLQEFVSIYKPDMDYITYSSLCKLKPITKEVFLVTVKYSTYKHFI